MPGVGSHERRIWRLAFLLTGNPDRAADLIGAVLRDQPKPGSVEPARLDRTIILHAREVRQPPGVTVHMSEAATRAMKVLLAIPGQPREAWVLTRLDDLDELRVSRAMDCSKTAAARHLKAADEQMRHRLGPHLEAGIAALKREADAIDPGPLIEVAAERRRKERLGKALIAGGVGVAVAAALGMLVLRLMF